MTAALACVLSLASVSSVTLATVNVSPLTHYVDSLATARPLTLMEISGYSCVIALPPRADSSWSASARTGPQCMELTSVPVITFAWKASWSYSGGSYSVN
ncbi:hypothetical protein PIIN_06838 [Serendipita indica DSM 11827]|uniref:Uncharacterized protein n=1 Tax=Serendipita indica (strain DSM 11827) TaxID=1109443 RepID=G4TNK9_SERID|nr:hypothetical protein PIIN_06838 [Serendipita indica DSM 11827]